MQGFSPILIHSRLSAYSVFCVIFNDKYSSLNILFQVFTLGWYLNNISEWVREWGSLSVSQHLVNTLQLTVFDLGVLLFHFWHILRNYLNYVRNCMFSCLQSKYFIAWVWISCFTLGRTFDIRGFILFFPNWRKGHIFGKFFIAGQTWGD